MSNTLANETHQRGLKDFLQLYNTITEYCFNKCISKFNERSPSNNETSCVDICTDNYVHFNQRFMFNFVDHQERRKREAEQVTAEAAAKEQEEKQKQLQQAAAAFAAGQEQAAADMAAASASSSPVLADLPLKTGQAMELLETLAGSSSGTVPPDNSLQNIPVSLADPVQSVQEGAK
ncbi:mitochondrial import inner membrane translocase subunit TIM9 [Elysia marginata]|uniref:Mitochondrial import inner membrane translocase subunit TIM9 n=1 Tax=Elysia marginata TaxID=1093978 RepID=A0AAV4GHL7_9GAST|nr:mitochondrial import inner membrane translocase subunit TIM9 [Elysia marginata]